MARRREFDRPGTKVGVAIPRHLEQSGRVIKRTVATVLWFLAAWTGVAMITVLAGGPSLLAPAVGLLVAAVVWWDPSGRLWDHPPDNARIRRRLADLPRVSESRREAEPRPEAYATRG